VLTAVYIAALPAAITGEWIRGTVLSTGGYVAAVSPLAADPVVRATVRTTIDGEVSLVVSHAIAGALPSRLNILASPLSNGLGSLAGNGTDTFMASPEFQRLWTTANATVHSQIIRVLNGTASAVATTNNEVVLNLAPLISAVLRDISSRLPTISTVPAAACRQIAILAHTRLPADCGQVPLVPASALTGARLAFRVLSDGTLALLILAPASAAAALLAAPRRRRGRVLLWMTIGGGLTILATVIAVNLLQSSLTARAQPRYQPLVSAVVHALTGGFFTLALWGMISSFVLATAALLARSRATIRLGRRTGQPVGQGARTLLASPKVRGSVGGLATPGATSCTAAEYSSEPVLEPGLEIGTNAGGRATDTARLSSCRRSG
jgi:hypothetical protein